MLTRTTDTDDSGSGTDGTPHNNAWLQGIYDVVDGRWSRASISSTGTQNNLSVSQADYVLFTNASDLTITGIAAPSSPAKPGKPLRYSCIGAGNVFFSNQDTGSTAANRIICTATGNQPHAGGSGHGMLVYDDANSRWRVQYAEQGAWITPTFSAGDYTATTGTWTVASGDVLTCKYRLSGRTLSVKLALQTTSVSATPTSLNRVLPGGFTAVGGNEFQWLRASDAGGAFVTGMAQFSGTSILFYSNAAGAGWSVATASTWIEAGWLCTEVS